MSATVIVSFQAKSDQVQALSDFLSGIQAGVMEAGGLSISLLQDQDDATRFFEVETWPSADAHKKFVQGAMEAGAFAPFDALLAGPFQVNYLGTVKHSKA
jgi:quinol monooxygenase YgiN